MSVRKQLKAPTNSINLNMGASVTTTANGRYTKIHGCRFQRFSDSNILMIIPLILDDLQLKATNFKYNYIAFLLQKTCNLQKKVIKTHQFSIPNNILPNFDGRMEKYNIQSNLNFKPLYLFLAKCRLLLLSVLASHIYIYIHIYSNMP